MIDRFIVGVDPGAATGGIAILRPDGAVVLVQKMPADYAELFKFFSHWASDIQIAYLELVHGMPHDSPGGGFNFGMHYGGLKMALVANGILFDLVDPRVWQSKMKALTGGDKNVTKKLAQKLYPDIKCTHSISDALLIATYGLQLIKSAEEQRLKRMGL